MRHAHPSDIHISKESDTRFVIDIPHRPRIACIEKRGEHWILAFLDPNEDGSPDIVTAYFTGSATHGVSIEVYISGWLMNHLIEIPD